MISIDLMEINRIITSTSEQLLGEHLLLLLLVLSTTNPHILKRRQTSQNTTSLPTHRVTLPRSQHSGLDLVWQHSLQLLQKSLDKALEQGVTTTQDDLVV